MSNPVTIQDRLDHDRLAKPSQGVAQVPLGLKPALRAFAQMSLVDPLRSDAKIELMLLVEREFNWLPKGTVVAVNYHNSTFLTGNDRVAGRCFRRSDAGGHRNVVGSHGTRNR